jgi:hypothetical protein
VDECKYNDLHGQGRNPKSFLFRFDLVPGIKVKMHLLYNIGYSVLETGSRGTYHLEYTQLSEFKKRRRRIKYLNILNNPKKLMYF